MFTVVLKIDLYLYAINFKDNQKKPLDFTFTDSLLLKYVTAGFQKIKRQRQLSKRVPTSIFYLQSVGDVSLVALLCIFSSFWGNTGALSHRRMRYFTLCDTANEKTKLSQALTYILESNSCKMAHIYKGFQAKLFYLYLFKGL